MNLQEKEINEFLAGIKDAPKAQQMYLELGCSIHLLDALYKEEESWRAGTLQVALVNMVKDFIEKTMIGMLQDYLYWEEFRQTECTLKVQQAVTDLLGGYEQDMARLLDLMYKLGLISFPQMDSLKGYLCYHLEKEECGSATGDILSKEEFGKSILGALEERVGIFGYAV